MASPKFTLAVIYAITAAGSWGLAGVFSKYSLEQGTPILIVHLQLGTSVLLSWLLVSVRNNSVEISRETWSGVLLGILHPGLSNILGIIGLTHVDASVSSTLWALEGPFTLTLAALVLTERLSGLQIVFSFISLGGVFLLSSGVATEGRAYSSTYGVALILIAALCCAVYAVGCRRFPSATPQQAVFVVAAQQTVGLVICATLWPLHWSFQESVGLADLSWATLFTCMLTGPLKFLFATGLFVVSLRYLPASFAGGFLVLTPVFGLATAFLILGEQLTVVQWMGIGIVLASVVVTQISGTAQNH